MWQKRPSGAVESLLLGATCAGMAALHWCKLETLASGDNVRWFLEAYRAARGEVPYRDFAFMYPPMGLWVFAASLRLFGETFTVLQLTIDVLGCAVCVLTWRIARRVLPPGPALAAAILTALAGGANPGNFALFSLALYTPSLLTGLVGVLLFLLPLLDRASEGEGLDGSPRAPRSTLFDAVLLASGGALACLSKIEFAVGIVGACAAGTALELARPRGPGDGPWRRILAVWVLALGPSALGYAWLAASVGRSLLAAAMTGYGVARQVCPWWPTGLGLLCALAAIGEAVLVVALASVPLAPRLLRRHGRRYWLLPAAAAVGLACLALQTPYALHDFGATQIAPTAPTWTSDAILAISYFLSFNGVLLPVMWSGIALSIGYLPSLAIGIARREPPRSPWGPSPPAFVMTAAAAGISVRGLFNGLFSDVSIVNQSAYPFWFILAGWLLLRVWAALADVVPSRPAARATACASIVLVAYGAVRVAHRVSRMRASGAYRSVVTAAGPVRLHGDEPGVALYDWIMNTTAPEARLLEVPWGGGLTFASHRRSAIYSTQFFGLAPSAEIQRLDVERLETTPPDAVIAQSLPNWGTNTGLDRRCSFPHLTFRASVLPDAASLLPVIGAIEDRYEEVARFSGFVALAPARRQP